MIEKEELNNINAEIEVKEEAAAITPAAPAAPVESIKPVAVENSRTREPRGEYSDKKKFFYTKKVCKFCTKQIEEKMINYKNHDLLRRYIMPSGKIVPRRITGNCAKHQRFASEEIKKARIIALLPFMDR